MVALSKNTIINSLAYDDIISNVINAMIMVINTKSEMMLVVMTMMAMTTRKWTNHLETRVPHSVRK